MRGSCDLDDTSQQLIGNRMKESHVFSSFDRQLVDRIMVDHMRDAVKWLTEQTKDELTTFVAYDLHVHEATGTSVITDSHLVTYFVRLHEATVTSVI